MKKLNAYIAIDADGAIVAVHGPTPNNINPLAAPESGRTLTMPPHIVETIVAGMREGKHYRFNGKDIFENQAPPRAAPVAPVPKSLTEVIHGKLWKIADEATRVRDRRSKAAKGLLPLKGTELGRQLDVAVLYLAGRLKAEDTIVATNWATGGMRKREITVAEWLDDLEASFKARQELRRLELAYRDQVAVVYRDPLLTDAQKIAAIEAIDVPAHYGLGEDAGADDIRVLQLAKNALLKSPG